MEREEPELQEQERSSGPGAEAAAVATSPSSTLWSKLLGIAKDFLDGSKAHLTSTQFNRNHKIDQGQERGIKR